MKLKLSSSKNPSSQTIWLGDNSLEALTRRFAPPSPKSGRGFFVALTIQVIGISSLHSRHTTQHQNSLLPSDGRRVGDEGGISAASSVKAIKAFVRRAFLEVNP